jgi:hypothetical protein
MAAPCRRGSWDWAGSDKRLRQAPQGSYAEVEALPPAAAVGGVR